MNEKIKDMARPPIWFWIVALLAIAWNLYGGYDCYKSLTLNADYLKPYGPDMVRFIETMPVWASAAWQFAVLSGIIGAVLLVLRKRWAAPVFGISLVAVFITMIYLTFAGNSPDLGPMGLLFPIGVIAVAIFEVWVSRQATKAGWIN